MNKGKIKGLNQKGFGFIQVDGMTKDLFFHISQLKGVDFTELQVGDAVEFENIEENAKGKYAVGVSLAA